MTAEKDEIAKRIGRNITNLLIENDMNQLELAKILDVHKATVSAWCNGTRIPRMRHDWIYNPLRYAVLC